MPLRLPLLGAWDVIDVAGIFGKAAPRVLDVVEIIRAEHVAAEAPAFHVTLVGHVGGADADVVDRAHVPAAMVEARRLRFGKGEKVMVAAVDAVHEGDEVRPAGEAQSSTARVELERGVDVRA